MEKRFVVARATRTRYGITANSVYAFQFEELKNGNLRISTVNGQVVEYEGAIDFLDHFDSITNLGEQEDPNEIRKLAKKYGAIVTYSEEDEGVWYGG